MKQNKYIIKPNLKDISLTEQVKGFDHQGNPISTKVVQERPLTVFLNKQEIVTLMTINDYPKYLALGYLINQICFFIKIRSKKLNVTKR